MFVRHIDISEWYIHIDSNEHRRKLFEILPKDYLPGEEYKPLEENDNFRIIEQTVNLIKNLKLG
jgi:hypothetical protein